MEKYIKIHKNDNVAVALQPLNKHQLIGLDQEEIMLLDDIPQGHKFSLKHINENMSVIKYGYSIGIAKHQIEPGGWVHTHNVKSGLGEILDYKYDREVSGLQNNSDKTYFQGFRRQNGSVGIRNEIWIIPTVGCVNNVATAIASQSQKFKRGSIDEIVAFPHPYGCSQMGEDQDNTRMILADLINHPNAGAVLVLGLGCENSNVEELKKFIGSYDEKRVKFLVAQECEDEIAESLQVIEEFAATIQGDEREPIDCEELIIGMKCGGSDGLSGITANPVVGGFSDLLIAKGGTTILTEVPEMFGAETILMNRCETQELFEKTVSLINDFKQYFTDHNQTIYENPSPGNKEGGITTLEDKSLGCTQKSGEAIVKGVLSYGEVVNTRGLNLLSSPGNDLVASTALAASGAHMVLFTTGRGTPFACPVPTVKISSNTELNNKKNNWIDFNCGTMVEDETLEMLSEKMFKYVMEVASGKKVKAEEMGYHDMAIFKQGVTL